jgi:O-antigen/teichoic acid export membrane protein
VAWTGSAKWLTQLISWPITILTARILAPADYGYIALVTVFTRLIAMLCEGGVGTAIVSGPALSRRQLQQLASVALGAGVAAFVVGCLMAWPIAWFYKSEPMRWIVLAISATLIADALALIPASLMRREFRFKELAVAEVSRNVVDQVVTLTLAVLGARYWALVGGYAAGVAVFCAAVLFRRAVGFARPVWHEIADSIRFSMHIVLRNVSLFLSSSSDTLVAGRLFSTAGVGAYNMAGTLAWAPVEKLTSMITRVTPALFAAVRDDPAGLRRYTLRISEVLSVLTVPMFVGFAVVAPDAVAMLLGPKWAATVVPLRWLCIAGALSECLAVVPHALQAVGATKALARSGVAALFLYPPGFLIAGLFFGLPGIAAVYAIVGPGLALWQLTVLSREIQLSRRDFLRNLMPAMTCTAIMLVGLLGVGQLPAVAALGSGPRLALLVPSGMVLYVGAALTLFWPRVCAIWDFARRQRPGAAV